MIDNNTIKTKPNLIIAGTVKGGTTSIFTYLANHIDVDASKVKETCFFLPTRYEKKRKPLLEYEKFFHNNHCDSQYVMESTPGYLDGGKKVALDIQSSLGSPKIIFVLRNPVDRLISFFKYHKAQLSLPKDLEINEYIRHCQKLPIEQKKLQENDAFWGIDGGYYIDYLKDWFDVFDRDNICIIFFDDLVRSPENVMTSISDWLEIEKKPFENMSYSVENRTIAPQFPWIHKCAIASNKFFEPFLRKYPFLKRTVRFMYYSLNSGSDEKAIASNQKKEINQLYREKNQALNIFLKKQGYANLPAWIKEVEETV